MLERSKHKLNNYYINSIINKVKEANGTNNPTVKEVLEYMLGDCDGWVNSDYVVYKYNERTKRTFIHRANMLWVYPLFILTIPIQYLFTGVFGLNRNSRVGKIVDWLVKFD